MKYKKEIVCRAIVGVHIIFWRDKKEDQCLMLYKTKFSFYKLQIVSKMFQKYLTYMYNG